MQRNYLLHHSNISILLQMSRNIIATHHHQQTRLTCKKELVLNLLKWKDLNYANIMILQKECGKVNSTSVLNVTIQNVQLIDMKTKGIAKNYSYNGSYCRN